MFGKGTKWTPTTLSTLESWPLLFDAFWPPSQSQIATLPYPALTGTPGSARRKVRRPVRRANGPSPPKPWSHEDSSRLHPAGRSVGLKISGNMCWIGLCEIHLHLSAPVQNVHDLIIFMKWKKHETETKIICRACRNTSIFSSTRHFRNSEKPLAACWANLAQVSRREESGRRGTTVLTGLPLEVNTFPNPLFGVPKGRHLLKQAPLSWDPI